MLEQANRYIQNVLSGKEVACLFVKQAVERHLADLKKRDWPFEFDSEKAEAATKFFRALKHTSGSLGGSPFNLQDNQAFIIAMLFGWRWKATGRRRFTQAYLEMARKAGKSELAAGIEIYTGFFEKEEGAQVFTAATTRDQADMVFRAVKKMCRFLRKDSLGFSKLCEVRAHSVNFSPNDAFIQKVSADAGTLDGLNPHCAVIDEYHAHKSDEVKGVMQTGMGARESPLLLIITTAGFDKDAPCFRVERKNAVAVLSGERTQDNLFAMIFTLDEGDDWQDESVWKKANPNLGSTPTVQYLREQVRDAVNKGSSTRTQVLTKNFNVWMDAPTVWIPDEQVRAVMREVSWDEFAGRSVYVGIDLAAVKDITAVSVFAPGGEDSPALAKVVYFLPEATVEARAGDTSYREWAESGHLVTTGGTTADYGFIRRKINELQGICNVVKISCDQWNAYSLATDLQGDGFEVVFCRQSFGNLSEPTKRLEKMVLSAEVQIDANPVTEWMFRNVALDIDANDNIKPNKKKSGEKIDGVAATLDAMFAWLTDEGQEVQKSYLF
jgi:phage terminase large subunit-like protein